MIYKTNTPKPPCSALLISIKFLQSCHAFGLVQLESQSIHFHSSLILNPYLANNSPQLATVRVLD